MKTCKMPPETAWRRCEKMAICSSLAIGLLIACKPTEPSSLSEEVTLTYAGASESNAFFRLENHTSHEIYVQGERGHGQIPSHMSPEWCALRLSLIA
jgi:hypothetical protein